MTDNTLPAFIGGAQGSLFDRDRPISYAELELESARVAQSLRALGLRAGDRLALWLPNVPAWLAVFFACARLGATAVAVNTRFKSHELADIIARSRCRLLVYWPGFRRLGFDSVLSGCEAQSLRSLEGIIAYTEDDGPRKSIHGKPTYRYSELREASPLIGDESHPDAACLMFTTSGTTKAPKFVVHNQQAVVRHAAQAAIGFGYVEPDARVLMTVPLCGGFGFCNAMAAISANRPLIMYPTFDATEAAGAVRRHAITHTNATDEMFAQMLDAISEPIAFPSVRFFGYSAFSPALSDFPSKAEARGLKLVGLYGSSEMQGLFARQDEDAVLPDRIVGGGLLVSPEAQVRARDPDSGLILAHNCPGELEFHGPSRMVGYFENEEANQAATTADGWFRSGDLGYTASERRFTFLSRLGDAFRLSGFMVSPVEIEDVLQQHPDVEAAQVVSAETSSGLKAVGFVIPRPGARFDEATLVAHCTALVARYKVPIRIAALESFPTAMSANASKIQKSKLRELAQSLVSEIPGAPT
jgi:fatty-acyl-CoA synthase